MCCWRGVCCVHAVVLCFVVICVGVPALSKLARSPVASYQALLGYISLREVRVQRVFFVLWLLLADYQGTSRDDDFALQDSSYLAGWWGRLLLFLGVKVFGFFLVAGGKVQLANHLAATPNPAMGRV